MRRATKRRVQLFFWLVLAGALIGTAYGSVIGRMFRETGLIGGSIGAIDGAAITVPIAAIEIFALRTRWGRAVQHAPFLVTFGLKWLAYGVLISIINLRSLGVFLLGLVALAAPLPVSVALWSVAFSFAVAFAFLFVFQVSQIVGPRTLGHIVFGRYHQPHLEDRFFLFVDIRGSTTLAERIEPYWIPNGAQWIHELRRFPREEIREVRTLQAADKFDCWAVGRRTQETLVRQWLLDSGAGGGVVSAHHSASRRHPTGRWVR